MSRIKELADCLVGTNEITDWGMHEIGMNFISIKELHELYNLIFKCNVCGLWHYIEDKIEDEDICCDCDRKF